MDFTYDEEQDGAARRRPRPGRQGLLRLREQRRRAVGRRARLQREAVDAGWPRWACSGCPSPRSDGGMGAGPVEIAIVAQELGRVIAPEPFLTSVVLAGGLVAAAGTAEQRTEILGALSAGESVLAFAHAEPGPAGRPPRPRVTATQDGDGWTLDAASRSRCPTAPAPTCSWSAPRCPTGRHRACSWSPATPTGVEPRAATRPTTAGAPPRSRSTRPRPRRWARPAATAPPRSPRCSTSARIMAANEAIGVMEVRAHATTRLPQEPQAVRRHAQHLPGADLPRGRHVRLARAGPQPGRLGDDGARRRATPPRWPRPPRAPRCRSAGPAGTSARRRSSCTAASG